jgi:hypothetical protein
MNVRVCVCVCVRVYERLFFISTITFTEKVQNFDRFEGNAVGKLS